ncbi:MAG: FecR domain-containing protein [Candidatus Omnitrophota bacterium]
MKKLFLILIGLFLITNFIFAGEEKKIDKDAYFAQVESFLGDVLIRKSDSKDWVAVVKDMQLNEGDVIKTGVGATAQIKIISAGAVSVMKVKEKAEVKISLLYFDKRSQKVRTELDLAIGEVLIKAKRPLKPSSFEVKTPTSIVGVRGTVFSVNVIEII